MKKIGCLVALFLLIGASSGWSSLSSSMGDWLEDQAKSDNYGIKAYGMILRGLDRIVESPVEIACHTYKGATGENLQYGVGVLKGLGMGTLWMVDDILRGAWDVITFAFPDYHGEPGSNQQTCWGGGGAGTTTAATT